MKRNTSHITDSKIILGCSRKQSRFQKMLFIRYSGQILTTCRLYSTNDYPAKDILQDTFIKVFDKIHQYNPDRGPIVGWIRRIAINMALDHYKKSKIRTVHIDSDTEELLDVELAEIDDTVSRYDEEVIMQLIQSLPTGYKTVFNLYLLDGYSHSEIAKFLSISISTSKSQLFKAKKLLKEKLVNHRKRRNENV